MGRAKPKPAEAVILPPDLDDDDEEHVGGGIPDDDGWIHLREKRKEKANGEDEGTKKPRRRSRQ